MPIGKLNKDDFFDAYVLVKPTPGGSKCIILSKINKQGKFPRITLSMIKVPQHKPAKLVS